MKLTRKRKVITLEIRNEYTKLLDIWENQWGNMTKDEVRRFLVLERMIEHEKKKQS